ncbi:uridine-cytidine kinase 1-like protein [Syncephalis pseudoplumigaleata]|uniref:uridine/cytidine kinase n=1 Tax=Syncephalis pseudoplumigaleata TaxID=1712513 RepID=A0A4P9Z0K6_9FUNG|nr:uridine-cytidine kinase 1-like protein [Syncephalis pseudoplumigaleata]|eukprot:RKP24880.1 uridine-cytidine kinase 1-like protein [Syncephalis pseudoplumigaleata]
MVRQQLLDNGKCTATARDIVILHQSDFYRELTDEERQLANSGDFNFDHPDALDFELMEQVLRDLTEGNPVAIAKYDFTTQQRGVEQQHIGTPHIVIFEGTYLLYKPSIRDYMSLKVFLDIDSDTRLARRVIRDTEGRRQTPLDQVLQQYVRFVKPSFERYILPTKIDADLIVPRGSDNQVAVTLIVEHVDDVMAAAVRVGQDSQASQAPAGGAYRTNMSRTGNHSTGSVGGDKGHDAASAMLRSEPDVYTQVPN